MLLATMVGTACISPQDRADAKDRDGDGYESVLVGGDDCDDGDDDVHPDADETCNDRDDDCDGEVDEADAVDADPWFQDLDGDGWGNPDVRTAACEQPNGYTADATDCDDDDPSSHPEADEVCDQRDNDCDDSVDEDAVGAPAWHPDEDGDGYGSDVPMEEVQACEAPNGYLEDGSDCNDHDRQINPGAEEIWYDGTDQDCEDNECDADGDGFDAMVEGYPACTNGDDCDDGDDTIHPAAEETWYDGVDQDCSGGSDDDQDGDGYDAADYGGDDCDDLEPTTYPDAPETCWDGIDSNCNDLEDCLTTTGDASLYGYSIQAVTGNGDMNGDGYDDLIVAGSGKVWALYGPLTDVDLSAASDYLSIGSGGGSGYNNWFASVGDVNGDGVRDYALTTHSLDPCAYVLPGPPTSGTAADEALFSVGAIEGLGYSYGIAGGMDATGDGIPDVLVGINGGTSGNGGAALLFSGTCAGQLTMSDATQTIYGEDQDSGIGAAVAVVQDTDGDGIADLLAGDASYEGYQSGPQPRAGIVVLVSGGTAATTLMSEAAFSFEGVWSGTGLGASIASAGDTNGDGYGDILVGSNGGAYGAWLLCGPLSGNHYVGSTSTDFDPATFDPPYSTSYGYSTYGSASIEAGDVNADGFADFLIGGPSASSSGDPYSANYLFLGPVSGHASADHADTILYGSTPTSTGHVLGRAADTNADGYDDFVVVEAGGTAWLFLGGSF